MLFFLTLKHNIIKLHMRDSKFITCCPDDTYYTWQVHLWLESLKENNLSSKACVLVLQPSTREPNNKWDKIVDLYPEAEFHFYKDRPTDNLQHLLRIYIPIVRTYLMYRYTKDFPQEALKPMFFCDSDILFKDNFKIDHLLEDDITYVSNSNSYMDKTYFDNKIKEVRPEMVEEYKTRDILGELLKLIGLDNTTITKEQHLHSGGVQYLFKGMGADFWQKCINDSIVIRTFMQHINTRFFPSQELGFQSWCADMWAILWNLWYFKQEVKIVDELDFSWSTDTIDIINRKPIMHNAGVTGSFNNGIPMFFKGKYHLGTDPTKDEHLMEVINSVESQKYGSWYYAMRLKHLSDKYKLNY